MIIRSRKYVLLSALASTLLMLTSFSAAAQELPFAQRTTCDQPSWNAKHGIYLELYQPSLRLHSDLLYDDINGFSERAKFGENVLQLYGAVNFLAGYQGPQTALDVTADAAETAGMAVGFISEDVGGIVAAQLLEWAALGAKPTPEAVVSYIVMNTLETAVGLYGTVGINALVDDYRRISAADIVLSYYYRYCGDQQALHDELDLPFKQSEAGIAFLPWAVMEFSSKGDYSTAELNELNNMLLRVLQGVNGTYQQLNARAVATPDLWPDWMRAEPSIAGPGATVTVEFEVDNWGEGAARPSRARLRLTRSRERVTVNDPILAAVDVPAVSGGESLRFEEAVMLPQDAGKYYIWLILDVNSEAGQTPADEQNDKRYEQVEVEYPSPNLRPNRLDVSPYRPHPGEQVTVEFYVENDGDGAAKASLARVRLSTRNYRVTTDDPVLTTIEVPPLAGGEELRVERVVQLPTELSPGDYYVWLILDVTSQAGQTFADEGDDKRYESMTVEVRP